MNTELVAWVLAVTCMVLGVACFLLASERDHWKREYESLRNSTLAQAQPKRVMTLDEFVDSQG